MTQKIYDVAVKTGEYTDRNGETKGRWLNVGAVMRGDNGGQFIMLHRHFNPAGVPDLSGKGGDSVLLSCFEPKQYGGTQQQAPQQSAPVPPPAPVGDDPEDQIPF